MAVKAPSGSGNKVIAYSISGSGIDTAQFTFDKNTNEGFTGDVETDDLSIELTSLIDNAAFLTFKQTYLTNVNISTEEITYTDGTTDNNITVPSTAQKLLFVHQGGQISGTRKLTAFEGIIGVSQGAKSANTTNEITVTLQALPASTNFTLSSVIIDADFDVTGSADLTFATDAYGTEVFVTSA